MQAGKHSHPYTIDGKCAEAKRSRSTAVEGALGTPTERRGGGGGGGGGGGPEEEEEGWEEGVRRRSRLLLQARELNKDRPSRHSRVWAFRHCSSTGPTSDPRPVGGRSGGVTRGLHEQRPSELRALPVDQRGPPGGPERQSETSALPNEKGSFFRAPTVH
ncbi:unnamed protein product [Prorocentrum cordatum]|uniref:Uncharacterized protein n=1 Tax=Prorocentrum cordatum TaxID=2364126 RepID=A0ABN9Q8S4_9DINO|nr:unnamed protein product [Polarella glacialis]